MSRAGINGATAIYPRVICGQRRGPASESFLYVVPESGLVIPHHILGAHPIGKPILSGGATGPEGSVFIIPILAPVILGILFTLPPHLRGYVSKIVIRRLDS
jgi:hypothetical protein